jgi:tRNA(fMet)-specific endonuclease VapC
MTRYLLDINHASAVLKQHLDLSNHSKHAPDDEFGVCVPYIGELWYMVFNSSRIDHNVARLNSVLQDLNIWHYDEAAAIEFGRIRAECRRAGRPISGIDAQIAAVARINQLVLLTDDNDFSPIVNLKLDNWIRS